MPLDTATYKNALSRFASGVTVVTTMYDDTPHGLTVSAFSSVSATPPRVLVCLGNETQSRPLVEKAGRFAVHILGREHVALGPRFAKFAADAGDPFDGLSYRFERTGCPVLIDCLAWLDCQVETTMVVGDHTVFIGAVEAAGFGATDSEPVLYYQRNWRLLDPNPVEV